MTHIAAYEAYDAVEIRLPNRPVVRCRALTMRWAMRFLRRMEQAQGGDAFAAESVFVELPRAVTPRRWGFLPLSREARKARRLLLRLRGFEVMKILNLFFPDPPKLIDEPAEKKDAADAVSFSMDDMIAEYAVLCGGPPPPNMAYPLFVAIVGRRARFEARTMLSNMTATNWGSGMSKDTPEVVKEKRTMAQLAYGRKPTLVFALKQRSPDA